MNVVMIPSVSGGMGHIGRTATLARMLTKLDPTINVEYLLDTERLRPFNIDATARTGFRVNLMPTRDRDNRDAVVRTCLKDAHVIVDDTSRYLIPYRTIVPQAGWVSVPMYPLWDELFMDWPFLLHTDAVLWAYPPVLDFPHALAMFGSKVLRTGPFLELSDIRDRTTARSDLGLDPDAQVIVYAPRGMGFGREFGETVLAGVLGGAMALRDEHPKLRLVLLAVEDRAELRSPGVPDELPEWVTIKGIVPHVEMLTHIRAADIAVTEGSNMTQEAAALGTPIMMIPGTIYESWLLGTRLHEHDAARIEWIERVTPESIAAHFRAILDDVNVRERLVQNARELVWGGGGVEAAARRVIEVGRAYEQGSRTFSVGPR